MTDSTEMILYHICMFFQLLTLIRYIFHVYDSPSMYFIILLFTIIMFYVMITVFINTLLLRNEYLCIFHL